MNALNRYLCSVYQDGGRGPYAYNCWTLTRVVRHELYGCSLLCEWGLVDPANKRQVTEAWGEAATMLQQGKPELGAIACVFRGRLLLHVGVVVDADRGLSVLETTPEHGPRILTLARFEQEYTRVEYWNDKPLPQQDFAGAA